MDSVSETKSRNQLPDLDSLDVESLKALVLTKQTEIENLHLLVLKLRRMHFGQKSEKRNADIAQLELRLEDLETSQAAADPFPAQVATIAVNEKVAKKPARRPLPQPNCRVKWRLLHRSRKSAPTAVVRYARWAKTSPRCSNTFPRASK
jgi:hypothetical protein